MCPPHTSPPTQACPIRPAPPLCSAKHAPLLPRCARPPTSTAPSSPTRISGWRGQPLMSSFSSATLPASLIPTSLGWNWRICGAGRGGAAGGAGRGGGRGGAGRRGPGLSRAWLGLNAHAFSCAPSPAHSSTAGALANKEAKETAVPLPSAQCRHGVTLSGLHLLRQQLHVGARRERHNLKLVGVLRHNVQRLGADGAGGAQQRELLRRAGGGGAGRAGGAP